jgi:DNA mismatch repair protein MutL
MADIIQLLPDAVANQIAAGEVIQRPASVVKELIENAVDAGADNIKIIIKDAGKTLIQVIDNGAGMSETDARMAFERHATSKIKSADDLFAIRTKGFRGEALASIASIAHVTLKTMQPGSEIGTEIILAGSKVESQNPVSCQKGTNFLVKNLFYNVPARRKFLKSNTTEFKHILTEFHRVALAHQGIEFTLKHNDSLISHLPVSNQRQRITHVFGKNINQNINNLENSTSIASINGFVGKPECARKTSGEQYFFINQRYMRHPYFHRAVTKAYENIIPSDCYPTYFIYFEVEPNTVDINIHPTKTEIKFEDEQALFQIIVAAVREALGKSNSIPSIDFDTHGVIDIPVLTKDTEVNTPEIPVDSSFNPFEPGKNQSFKSKNNTSFSHFSSKKEVPKDWDKLYQNEGFSMPDQNTTEINNNLFGSTENEDVIDSRSEYLQFKGKYILTSVKSGLMAIDQRRAHIRILFENYVRNLAMNQSACQRSLYPAQIDLNHEDYLVVLDILDDLNGLGFDISDMGSNTIVINGVPESGTHITSEQLMEQLIEEYKQTENSVKGNIKERISYSLAKSAAINYGKILSDREMRHMVDELFACENPNYTPSGKKTLSILNLDEIDKLFN